MISCTSSRLSIIMALLLAAQIFQVPHRTTAWTIRQGGCYSRQLLSSQVSLIAGRNPYRHTAKRLRSTASENANVKVDEKYHASIVSSGEQQDCLDNWRDHPAINPTIIFPTLLVPAASLQRWIQEPQLQQYLAKPSNSDLLHHIHPRIKMVHGYNDTHKLVLLHDGSDDADNEDRSTLVNLINSDDGMNVELGPNRTFSISFQQLSFGYILRKLLPVSPPTAYEQIGHVAHFNLKPHHAPYGALIGQVLRETNPTIDTVVSKVGEVKGKYRTYDLEVLAGPANFETTVVEHGIPIRLNVADCYWCTRLSGERQELLRDIEHTAKKKELVVADVFCGVGAVCLLLAKNQPTATILVNDWNPKAIEYMTESVAQNGFDKQFKLNCGDTYDYLIDLGDQTPLMIPDHVLMNYPLEAPSFLGALRWWPSKGIAEKYDQFQHYPRFHVYTFARSEKDVNDEEEVAVNIIANQLLPGMYFGSDETELVEESGDEDTCIHRREELDDEFGAKVHTRLVRDVAPGKVVVCVSFSVTPKLVRYMQGDYS